MPNRIYSPELKAQVISAVAMGESQQAVAARLNVPRSTVRVWTRDPRPVAMVTAEKQADVDSLFTDFVSDTLLALRAAARLGQDEAWIQRLPPKDAYLWFGTLSDKVLAALSAYEAADERRSHTTDGIHTP